MASKKIQGIDVVIGGDTTKLGKALDSVEKKSFSLQNELKAVEKLLKLDPNNTELVSQKMGILSDAVEQAQKKLKTLKDAQEDVKRQFDSGEIDEGQYRAFQREIAKTEIEIKGLEKQLEETEDALKQMGDSADKAENDVDDLGESADQAEDNVKKLGESAENSGEGFTVMKGALADMVANVISSAISKIGDLVGQLFELSEATEEYRQMQAKLEGSADTFGYSVDFAKEKYEEFYKYMGDDQMATNAITNLMGLGTSTENITALAEGATAVWATYGDSIPIESLTEAINETIQVGKVTGTFADTINWAKISNEDMAKALGDGSKAQKAFNDAIKDGETREDAFSMALSATADEQERADIVAQFLNQTYGESKKAFDESADSILDANEAELELKETQAQLGEAMQPVNTAITDLKNKALQAIAPLVERCAQAFLDMLTWLKEHPTTMTVLTAIVIALASAFAVLAGALAIQGIITGVTKAIAFLNTTLLANPIVLITALIVGLVAGFMYLWKNCDAFREFWLKLWDKIQAGAKKAFNALKTFFTKTVPQLVNNIANWFKSLPGKISSAISGAISRVKTWGSNLKNTAVNAVKNLIANVVNFAKQLPGKIWSAIQGAIGRVKEWGSSLVSTAGNAIKNMVSKVVDTAKSLPGKFLQIGKDIINGIKNGISSAVGGLYSSIKNSLSGLVDKAKKALGINSPSKVFADVVGKAIPEGIAKGVDDNTDLANDSVVSMADEIARQDMALNGATITRKLNTTFNAGGPAVSSESAMLAKLDGIYDRLNHLQIVLDTGTLVGETIDKIDSGLAKRQLLNARGV